MIGIIPFINIVSAFGLICLANIFFRNKLFKNFLIITIATFFTFNQLFFYFSKRPSDWNFQQKDFILEDIVNYIKNDNIHKKYYIVKNDTYQFDLLHNLEKIEFLTYPKTVEVIGQNKFLTLFKNQNLSLEKIVFIRTTPTNESIENIEYKPTTRCNSKNTSSYIGNFSASFGSFSLYFPKNCFFTLVKM